MSLYYDNEITGTPWHPDMRTADELLYGGSSSIEALRDIATDPSHFTPSNQTGVELYRKPGTKAGIVYYHPTEERAQLAAGAPNPQELIGNLPSANQVQVALPGRSPILERFWGLLTDPVEFNLEHAGPTAGFPLVEKPPILTQAASAVGISPNALGWIVLGTLLLVLPLVLRK